MARVRVGDTVYWSETRESDIFPAIVLDVARNTIAVAVFVRGSFNVDSKEGCRHRLDPDLVRLEAADDTVDMGVWRHRSDYEFDYESIPESAK